jgi:protein-S-isoprenylcysteine O-methyltransferase Ste14
MHYGGGWGSKGRRTHCSVSFLLPKGTGGRAAWVDRLSMEIHAEYKFIMLETFIFLAVTAGLAYVSRGPLRQPTSHGFSRFFAWECMLALFLLNVRHWFAHPFSFHQIISWILLLISLGLALPGMVRLLQKGRVSSERRDSTLFEFEKTTKLVTDGIYGYIRHPLYGSLLFLGWGIFFKNPGWIGLVVASVMTLFLVRTARAEEQENVRYFGEPYEEYMKRTSMFVPYLF